MNGGMYMRIRTLLITSIRYGFYWLFIYVCSYEALAQKSWTLTECLSFAQKNNPQIQQASLLQNRSLLQRQQAKNQFLPTLDARVRSAGNWGFIIDPSTNLLSNQFNFGNQASINLNLDLFNGLSNVNRLKLRNQEVTTANYGYEVSVNDVIIDVTYAYLQILLAHEQLKSSKIRSGYLNRQQQKIQASFSKGILNKGDLLTIQSLVAAEELMAVYAETNIEKATFTLMNVMGMPLNEAITVDTVRVPDNWQMTKLTLDELLNTSTATLPDLKAADSKVQTAYYLWQSERAIYLPALTFTAQIATRTSNYKPERFNQQLRTNLNQQVGLSLYLPIFNRLMLRNIDQIARLDMTASKLAYQQVDRELRGKIVNAFLDYKAAARKYQALLTQYEAVREAYRYAERTLELGSIDAIAFGVTRSQLVLAQSELLQAKYDSFFKQKVLDFYQGKPLFF
ncbi:TolC family protein [Spirosoma aerolatum]|uniref:TolC family protein n=1 Tax=Spirosoma aerolatum TaxID=1211326 RepID=UPI0009AE6B4E|nr:TolC family protein [Spirosoma aerolatum]